MFMRRLVMTLGWPPADRGVVAPDIDGTASCWSAAANTG